MKKADYRVALTSQSLRALNQVASAHAKAQWPDLEHCSGLHESQGSAIRKQNTNLYNVWQLKVARDNLGEIFDFPISCC